MRKVVDELIEMVGPRAVGEALNAEACRVTGLVVCQTGSSPVESPVAVVGRLHAVIGYREMRTLVQDAGRFLEDPLITELRVEWRSQPVMTLK